MDKGNVCVCFLKKIARGSLGVPCFSVFFGGEEVVAASWWFVGLIS